MPGRESLYLARKGREGGVVLGSKEWVMGVYVGIDVSKARLEVVA